MTEPIAADPAPAILAALLNEARVFRHPPATDKATLLATLAERSAAVLHLEARTILAKLQAREALGSTGVGGGIALPHARLAGLAQPFGFLAMLSPSIDFGAVDGSKVDLVFLLLSPADDHAGHLRSLAAASRQLRRPEIVKTLRATTFPADVLAALTTPAADASHPGSARSTG